MGLDNDTRGWIMTALSGVACIFGASIICVDVIVRLFPGKRQFRIQDSNAFLSSSLSLSFGVMMFSSLYSMLPSAKSNLRKGGFSSQAAAWTLIGCFMGGIIGIQVISRILHRFMPSHVVGCDHTHPDEDGKPAKNASDHHASPDSGDRPEHLRIAASESYIPTSSLSSVTNYGSATPGLDRDPERQPSPQRRASLHDIINAKVTQLVSGTKNCDDDDETCYGFTERPCGTDCFQNIAARGGTRSAMNGSFHSGSRGPELQQSAAQHPGEDTVSENSPLLGNYTNDSENSHKGHRQGSYRGENERNFDHQHESRMDESTAHHHHVPTNAFMSIGLQTSIAIALHKLPEGFITYATNHANPQLGVSVFMALFIHNITEGFAMALPLYLAIGSRWKAMLISSVLGGVSQPLGAGIAAGWFWLAGGSAGGPGEAIYGAMFAITAGIMASVALQLFNEGLDLGHNRDLCMAFAFIGMGVLGASSALTA